MSDKEIEKSTYSYDEAYEASLNYFQGDELAARVWLNKYAMKDSFGNIYEKSPVDMHWRLAREIARIESKYPNALSAEEVFELLDHFQYIVPAGSPMTGIGNNHQVASLSNCFVIGVDGNADSYGAIIKIDEEQVQLMKRRGGVGHGKAIGGVIDGFPSGIVIDEDFVQEELNRRRPGQSLLTTPRSEDDKVEFLSGIFEGRSTGCPIGFVVWNRNQHSADYESIKTVFRPSHALSAKLTGDAQNQDKK